MTDDSNSNLEHAIESALSPGTCITDWHCSHFVTSLKAVQARITPFIGSEDDAARAVRLLETFIAGCHEKSEEIDDSSASFGMFVGDLFCDWIRARQAAGAEAGETVRMLLSWMESDGYGYCYRLETEVVRVLDCAGLAALEGAVRGAPGEGENRPFSQGRRVEILKAIHGARCDVGAYAALCEAEDGLAPADCEALAQMCLARGEHEDALGWVERGLELDEAGPWPGRPSSQLLRLRRDILKRLGRVSQALASAWEAFRQAPSVYAYDELVKYIARGECAEWHEKAMAALAQAKLSPRIDLLVRTKEWARLAEPVDATPRRDLVGLSHYTTGPAAAKLKQRCPLGAAKLLVAMALRILASRSSKKSQYYGAALESLERARRILRKEGHDREWEALAGEIRSEHSRQTGFIPGFERLTQGRSLCEPSFRERARRRWRQGAGRRGARS